MQFPLAQNSSCAVGKSFVLMIPHLLCREVTAEWVDSAKTIKIKLAKASKIKESATWLRLHSLRAGAENQTRSWCFYLFLLLFQNRKAFISVQSFADQLPSQRLFGVFIFHWDFPFLMNFLILKLIRKNASCVSKWSIGCCRHSCTARHCYLKIQQ